MAVPLHLMRRLSWGNLKSRLKGKGFKIARDRALIGIAKLRRREIGMLAAELNIPAERLREYFNRLKLKPIGFNERCDIMVETLREMKQLAIKTEIDPKRLKQYVEKKGMEWVLQEMRKRAQEVDAVQARAG